MALNRPLLPTSSPTSGSQSVAGGAGVYTFPRGVYNVSVNPSTADLELYFLVSSTARFMQTTVDSGCAIFSDGTNVKVINNNASARSFYYQKY
jgi:hypothetical protein